MISPKDRQILRELAKEQLHYATSPAMTQIKADWLAHNTFKGKRPMVHIELGTFGNELIEPLLKCEGDQARNLETTFYRNIINHKLFKDDFVVKDFFPVGVNTTFKLFGIDIRVERAAQGVGHHFVPVIEDLERDFHKLGKTEMTFDMDATHARIDFLNELFGDILPAKLTGHILRGVATQHLVHIMGMENMFTAMYDYPDLFKQMMNRIAEDHIAYYKYQADNNLLRSTVASEHLGQGSWCFTDELPSEKEHFTPSDVWGFMDSQETVGISAEMFGEFIFPCYKKLADSYGLLSYGCCEPVDTIWDDYISKLPNLRKVSISPWCNEEFMGERLLGSKTIFHRKPVANFLGVDKILDEEAFTAHIDRTVRAASGCTLEITQRDVYTVHGNAQKVARYVEIIRQRCENWNG